jgi:8-oxo-dGTP pyrophosphatase MutT (NUDIX family)
MSVSLHEVQFDSVVASPILNDWLWVDYHDRINVLVQHNDNNGSKEEKQFLVFEQTKYALEGRQSLAIIGGIIEPNEPPLQAAQREVYEEMHLRCDTYHFLGRYRTDVNRGMGWLNSYLATDCTEQEDKKRVPAVEAHQNEEEEVGVEDTEKQQLKSISLPELRQAVTNGQFLEVQWTATVSLALLHPELNSIEV